MGLQFVLVTVSVILHLCEWRSGSSKPFYHLLMDLNSHSGEQLSTVNPTARATTGEARVVSLRPYFLGGHELPREHNLIRGKLRPHDLLGAIFGDTIQIVNRLKVGVSRLRQLVPFQQGKHL